jgi:hypothetical protein
MPLFLVLSKLQGGLHATSSQDAAKDGQLIFEILPDTHPVSRVLRQSDKPARICHPGLCSKVRIALLGVSHRLAVAE